MLTGVNVTNNVYSQHVMAVRVNHVNTSSFQLDCLTRVRPPMKAVRMRRL